MKLTDAEIEKLNEQKRRDEESALQPKEVRKPEERNRWKERDGYFQGAKVRRR